MKSRSLQSCPKTTFQPRMIQHSERNYDPYGGFVTAGRQTCATHEPPLLWSSPGLYCHLWNPTNERRDDDVTTAQRDPQDKRREMSKKRRHRREKEPPSGRFLTHFEECNLIYLHFSIAQHEKIKRFLILKTQLQ